MRPLKTFIADTVASTSTIIGIAALVLGGAAALSVDSSVFYVKKRRLQSTVDLAALAAVGSMTAADDAARASLATNGILPDALTVTTGSFDATRPMGGRFVAGGATPNAALVHATVSTPMILGRLLSLTGRTSTVSFSATGQAMAAPIAAFGLGSRLASVQGGVANSILSGLVGSQISLTAVDYESLSAANIDMGSYLNAVSVGTNTGTYADLLGTRIPLSKALAAISTSGVDTRTSAALASLLNALPATAGSASLGTIIDLGPADNLPIGSKLPASMSMRGFDLISDLAQIAAGNRQTTIDLSAAVPGLTDATLGLSLGDGGPATVVAPYGTTTTAWTRQVQITLMTGASAGVLGTVRLPIQLTLAKAKATTQGPTCQGGNPTLQLAVTPGVADLTIGGGTTPMATIAGVRIDGSAHAVVGSSAAAMQTFVRADVRAGTVKTTTSTSLTASLVSSALANLTLSVYGLGVPISLPGPTLSALTSALSGLATPTDTLLDAVARTLGVGIGQAETWVTDLKCGTPVLVQ